MRPFSTVDMPRPAVQAAARSARRSRHRCRSGAFLTKSAIRVGVDDRRRTGRPRRLAQECRLLGVAFDQVDLARRAYPPARRQSPSRESQRRSRDRPRPARSGASARSCSESAMWRVQSIGSVEGAIRLIRRCQSSSRATKRSRRAAVSRETGVSAETRGRGPAARSGDATGRLGRRSCRSAGLRLLPAQMRHQQRQRRRRDAVDPAGLADRARPLRLQLVADLVGQAGQRRVVDIVGSTRLSSRR